MSDKWLNRQRPGTRGRCYRLKELPFFSSKGNQHHHPHYSKLSLLSNHCCPCSYPSRMDKLECTATRRISIVISNKVVNFQTFTNFQIIFYPVHIWVTWKTYKELPSPWKGDRHHNLHLSCEILPSLGRDIVVWNDTFHYRFISEIQFKLLLVPNICWPCSYPSHLQKFECLIVAIKCEYRFPQQDSCKDNVHVLVEDIYRRL